MSASFVVVDTNVVSYVWHKNPLAGLYRNHLNGRVLAVSFITVGEMYFGAEKKHWGDKKRNELEAALHNYVVIPYDNGIAHCYARVMAERERKGRPISCADAWIAACALRHEVPLVTHNAKDFEEISGLLVVSERA
jgi:tRNA(fMet)-specific endonuclease VapC